MTIRISRRTVTMLSIVAVNCLMAALTAHAGRPPVEIVTVGVLTAPMMLAGVLANIYTTDGWTKVRATLEWLFSAESAFQIGV